MKNIVVILPTYNNDKTLSSVIDGVCNAGYEVIVVNDGSNDSTPELLSNYGTSIKVISYSPNKGKGYAICQGLNAALKYGYEYAITMDTDGQHRPEDLKSFESLIKTKPNSLIIGSRLSEHENKPAKNSFANRFSNFWVLVQTSLKLPDTQSGYRLYPLKYIQGMHIFSTRYEAEIELLVRLAWKGVNIEVLPIDIYYAPDGERVSHFRPFADFARISVLNTVLTFLAVVYGYPSMFIRFLKRKLLW